MANLIDTGMHLLCSGDYSDFTLVCEGQELRVHKGIICPQSPVIATAMKSEFKEAKTNTMEVNFNCVTLKCMLDYMYTGSYELVPKQPIQLAVTDRTEEQAQSELTGGNVGLPVPVSISDRLIYHGRVNDIADYYGVIDLAKLSANRVKSLLDQSFSADAFCNLIKETMGSTGDKHLREVLVQKSALNIFTLMDKDIFAEGGIANNMAAEVLKASLGQFQKKLEQEQVDKASLQAEKKKTDAHVENLNELAAVLWSTRTCSKRDCKGIFGCTIQRPEQNEEKRYWVRCTTCGCRQMYDRQRKIAVLAPPPSFT